MKSDRAISRSVSIDILVASRHFSHRDQLEFARLTGDRNPLHLDSVAARRTQLGDCVVHGMHLFLWALDGLARTRAISRPVRLRIRFSRPIMVGEQVALHISEDNGTIRAELSVDDSVCASFTMKPGTDERSAGLQKCDAPVDPAWPDLPQALSLAEMSGRHGTLAFAVDSREWESLCPVLCAAIGSVAVAALGCTSRLVGMVCPGLHSIFAGGDLVLAAGPPEQEHIRYQVSDADPRTRVVALAIAGGGIEGTLDTFVRQPPVRQPAARDLLDLLDAVKVRDTLSLVVGGSRGIGEVAAKIIAGSGGRVLLSYASGNDDAERVADEIRAAGGAASACRLDVRQPLRPQLCALGLAPTHAYYFATPQIFGRRSKIFDPSLFDDYCRFYVDAFWELCQHLAQAEGRRRLFYPSSIAVDERPRNLTEYAMAKAAGEHLCRDVGRFMPALSVVVRRLPRILTDQTATIAQVAAHDVVGAMLPAIREMLE